MNSHDEQEAPRYDDINTPVVLLVGAISAVITLITIFLVQGLCYHWQNEFLTRNQVGPTSMPAVQKIEEQKSSLMDSEKRALTIDAAMSAVVAEHEN